MRSLLAALALLAAVAAPRADEVEVIPLKHRSAEQLIPTLRPMVEPGGAISGMQSTLVIRASRANVAQLKQIVAALDTRPRRLLISVRQDGGAFEEARDARVSGAIGSGDVRVGVGEPAGRDTGVSARIADRRAISADGVTSQVHALEGSPALILAGQSVPVTSAAIAPGPGGTRVQRSTMVHSLDSGFYVIPRVSGDRVFLDIAPERTVPGRDGPGIAERQRIVTTASGRLGEWFALGGVGEITEVRQSGVLQGGAAARSTRSSVWVKVEEIP